MPCHSCVKLMKRDNACVNVNCVKNMYVVLLLAQCRITAGHLQLQISGIVLEHTANVWICTLIDKDTGQSKCGATVKSCSTKTLHC